MIIWVGYELCKIHQWHQKHSACIVSKKTQSVLMNYPAVIFSHWLIDSWWKPLVDFFPWHWFGCSTVCKIHQCNLKTPFVEFWRKHHWFDDLPSGYLFPTYNHCSICLYDKNHWLIYSKGMVGCKLWEFTRVTKRTVGIMFKKARLVLMNYPVFISSHLTTAG